MSERNFTGWSWVVFGWLTNQFLLAGIWLAIGGFLGYKVVSGHGGEAVSYSKFGNPQNYATCFVTWFVFSIAFVIIIRYQRSKT